MSTTKKTAKKAAKKVSKKAVKKSAPEAEPAKKKPAAKKKARKKAVKPITVSERHAMIAEAAYFIAEAIGFDGDAGGHWLHAETQIDASLAKGGYQLSA